MSQVRPHKINIDDLDAPLFRIYPLWFFEEALRLNNLVLVPPQKWEDPYESLPWSVAITRKSGQTFLEKHIQPVYAQCWSSTHESDILLRAYSRVSKDPHHNRNILIRDEGVRVKTTARKLIEAIIKSNQTYPKDSFYLGRVDYVSPDKIKQKIADMIYQKGEKALYGGLDLAKLMLLKRPAFKHEDEYRLLYIEERSVPDQKILQVSITPNDVFDEVTFDPRLATFERMEREANATWLGYRGEFGKSDLYQKLLLDVHITE